MRSGRTRGSFRLVIEDDCRLIVLSQVLDGDRVEQTGDRQSGRELMTKVANQSIVLLKNEGGVLPLKPKEQGLKKVAIVGGNAKATVLSGGGSAALKPSFFVSPYEGIVAALGKIDPNVEITYSEGSRCRSVIID